MRVQGLPALAEGARVGVTGRVLIREKREGEKSERARERERE